MRSDRCYGRQGHKVGSITSAVIFPVVLRDGLGTSINVPPHLIQCADVISVALNTWLILLFLYGCTPGCAIVVRPIFNVAPLMRFFKVAIIIKLKSCSSIFTTTFECQRHPWTTFLSIVILDNCTCGQLTNCIRLSVGGDSVIIAIPESSIAISILNSSNGTAYSFTKSTGCPI